MNNKETQTPLDPVPSDSVTEVPLIPRSRDIVERSIESSKGNKNRSWEETARRIPARGWGEANKKA